MFIDNDLRKSDPLPTTSGDGSVGNDCFTSPLWNRDVFQANRVEYGATVFTPTCLVMTGYFIVEPLTWLTRCTVQSNNRNQMIVGDVP